MVGHADPYRIWAAEAYLLAGEARGTVFDAVNRTGQPAEVVEAKALDAVLGGRARVAKAALAGFAAGVGVRILGVGNPDELAGGKLELSVGLGRDLRNDFGRRSVGGAPCLSVDRDRRSRVGTCRSQKCCQRECLETLPGHVFRPPAVEFT